MTLLTLEEKYVITSGIAESTNSFTFVDDPQASKTFTLESSRTVLIIYQANSLNGQEMNIYGMKNAISVDGNDFAISYDSNGGNMCVRNCVFWLGTLSGGSHTIKGRFAALDYSATVTIGNRILLIYVFQGNEFIYIDSDSIATTGTGPLVNDPYASATFTPSGNCKLLVLYNASNSRGPTEVAFGKKIAINIGGTDYSVAGKAPVGASECDSNFTVFCMECGPVQTLVNGRFTSARETGDVRINQRQLAVLMLDDSTLLDITTSDQGVYTYSNTLVNDPYAILNRTTSEKKELLVIAMSTKPYGVSSSARGHCYGVMVNSVDKTNSRGGCEGDPSDATSEATVWAEDLDQGDYTIRARFSNNFGSDLAYIQSRILIALWFKSLTPSRKSFWYFW